MTPIGTIKARSIKGFHLTDEIDINVLETDGSIMLTQDNQEINIMYEDVLAVVAMYQRFKDGEAVS